MSLIYSPKFSLDHAKLGHAFTLMKDLASVDTLSSLPKTLPNNCNNIAFLAPNSLKLT